MLGQFHIIWPSIFFFCLISLLHLFYVFPHFRVPSLNTCWCLSRKGICCKWTSFFQTIPFKNINSRLPLVWLNILLPLFPICKVCQKFLPLASVIKLWGIFSYIYIEFYSVHCLLTNHNRFLTRGYMKTYLSF